MTPWFAAGVGVVIAAALAVDSPIALTYGPSGPPVRCPASGCARPALGPGNPPVLATATPGEQIRGPGGPRMAAPAARRPRGGTVTGYQLGFRVLSRWQSGFVAVITVPGAAGTGAWVLQIAFPAARIDRVWGALWQPSGDGASGTARGPWQWAGYAQGSQGLHELVVFATGSPTVPSGCVLDGVSCSFG